MASDVFIKFETIEGESTDDKHANEIEVLSYSWGCVQPTTGARSSGGAGSGERVSMQDLTFTHTLDKASPKLFLACCKGESVGEVTLTLHRATGDKQKYMEYKMENVIISSYQVGGSDGGGLPMETCSLNFGKITHTYTETGHGDSAGGGDVTANWDQIKNTGG